MSGTYDFLNLSPYDFECLTRDLLQKKLNLDLECFTSGRDGGIDLRYSKDKGNTLIVQCKRYSKWSDLKSTLKKEKTKIDSLAPSQYILSTSVGLSQDNKGEIEAILSPHIKNFSDIIGCDDLNSLLRDYQDVEKKHFKLWMISTAVLEKILKSRIYNYADFEKEEIEKNVYKYVANDSFQKSLDIIKDNRFVIISGIPGIGKTTLARMLAYHFLAHDAEDFIYLTQNIQDAIASYNDERKQIFFYDDFLGRNFLARTYAKNEDKDIIAFIRKIKNSKDKILLFTTREYILKQAKQEYESFNTFSGIDLAKCTLDLTSYSRSIKAEILYNHLCFSGMPDNYIQILLKENSFLKIIDHNNYTPRLIDMMTFEEKWKDVPENDFLIFFLNTLDNPHSIWQHAFETDITPLSRNILLGMVSCRMPILMDDLFSIIQNFLKKQESTIDNIDFNKAIKELDGTFISCSSMKIGTFMDFHNPSVYDFLAHYIAYNAPSIISNLLHSALFYDQFFEAFQWDVRKESTVLKKNRIPLSPADITYAKTEILNNWDKYKSYKNILYENFAFRTEISEMAKLYVLYSNAKEIFGDFIVKQLNNFIASGKAVASDEHDIFAEMVEEYERFIVINDYCQFFDNFKCNMNKIEDLNTFHDFGENIYSEQFINYIKDDKFKDFSQELVWNEVSDVPSTSAEMYLDEVMKIEDKYDLDLSHSREYLQEAMQKAEDRNMDDESYRSSSSSSSCETSDEAIIDMFNSLEINNDNPKET